MSTTRFRGVSLLTAPGRVMTPRAATEALVDRAVELVGEEPLRVADVGTGSGAIAVALGSPRPEPSSGRRTRARPPSCSRA